uniref:Uncharacterized protein n=1 Tax=viral metagenome TaxID=1070528 RepID=A0A6C0HYX8_9ZZZZ
MSKSIIERRLAKEIDFLEEKMPKYQLLILDGCEDKDCNCKDKCNYVHIEFVTPNGNCLTMTLLQDYPFKPPRFLKINGRDYRFILKKMPKRIYYLYNNPQDMYYEESVEMKKSVSCLNCNTTCLCCDSLLCGDNWSPAIMLFHILKEIEDHNLIKRKIMYKFALKNLFDKRNLPLELLRSVYKYLV